MIKNDERLIKQQIDKNNDKALSEHELHELEVAQRIEEAKQKCPMFKYYENIEDFTNNK